MNPNFPMKPGGVGPFSPIVMDQIPETSQRGAHHRRAHSDTFFRFSDDLLFDVSDIELSGLDLPSSNTTSNGGLEVPMAVDSCRSDESSSDNKSTVSRPPPTAGHLRSLSMDADFFEGLSFGTPGFETGGKFPEFPLPTGRKRMGMHRRNNSIDGSSSLEGDSLMDGVLKKAMAPEKLAELALMDPKRAKRILANRQSAARSKERKIRYTGEMERKVQALQTEATTLSTQVTILQRDTSRLTAENRELKMRLQAMEQQANLRDALNEALSEEVQRLRIATRQIPSSNGDLQSEQPQFHPTRNGLQPGLLDFDHS